MKILKHDKLRREWTVLPGDSFALYIDGREVHAKNITQCETVSHWACVEVLGGIGYFVGDNHLIPELKRIVKAAK